MGRGLRMVQVSLWTWPVLAVLATAATGAAWGPRAAWLTIAGLGLLLAGMIIGAQWLGARAAAPVEAGDPGDTPEQGASGQRTILQGARMVGVKLAGAKLAGADMRDADLRGADLTGADLTGANMENAVLSPWEES